MVWPERWAVRRLVLRFTAALALGAAGLTGGGASATPPPREDPSALEVEAAEAPRVPMPLERDPETEAPQVPGPLEGAPPDPAMPSCQFAESRWRTQHRLRISHDRIDYSACTVAPSGTAAGPARYRVGLIEMRTDNSLRGQRCSAIVSPPLPIRGGPDPEPVEYNVREMYSFSSLSSGYYSMLMWHECLDPFLSDYGLAPPQGYRSLLDDIRDEINDPLAYTNVGWGPGLFNLPIVYRSGKGSDPELVCVVVSYFEVPLRADVPSIAASCLEHFLSHDRQPDR